MSFIGAGLLSLAGSVNAQESPRASEACYFDGSKWVCPKNDRESANVPTMDPLDYWADWMLLEPGTNGVVPNSLAGDTIAEADLDRSGKATRSFAGPSGFPPADFAAYAIVVFNTRVLSSTTIRWRNACKGYLAALMTPAEAGVPKERQLVTVWPLNSGAAVKAAEAAQTDRELCTVAINNYGLAAAQTAIAHVRLSSRVDEEDMAQIRDGRGPFIFAWNPGASKGQKDALILRVDMSDVETESRFAERFAAWRDEVQARQDLWADGWQEERIWNVIGNWADRWGLQVMTAMGWGPEDGS